MIAVSHAMRQALLERAPLAILVDIDHPDGRFLAWSGIGTLSWNGLDWLGVGKLGSIRGAQRDAQVAIRQLTFALSGVPADAAAQLTDRVRLRPAVAWLAAFDAADRVIADPIEIDRGVMDFQTLTVGEDGTSTIAVTCEAGFWTLERAIDVSWTHEEQQRRFAGDTGLDRIPGLVNREVAWLPPA